MFGKRITQKELSRHGNRKAEELTEALKIQRQHKRFLATKD